MYVIATAGHVDHGKSTLVRALTGIEPDRLAEEQRRGLTIDLGFAWTTLPSGRGVAFVDVPGHERFIANTLAGVGPVNAVCFVVAADQGWQAQSDEHLDAIIALGIEHAVFVISRSDRAPERAAATADDVRAHVAGTRLGHSAIVIASGTEHTGLDELTVKLDQMLAGMPAPDPEGRVRLWIDRSFSIRGSGTVVTGTLAAGTVRGGDTLHLIGGSGTQTAHVRGLHSRNDPVKAASPTARVAVNLRDVPVDRAHRGDALISPDLWEIVDSVDVGRVSGPAFTDLPKQAVVHIGTAAVQAYLRAFDDDHARIALRSPLPLQLGDRLVVRDPGRSSSLVGAVLLDLDPPSLTRRGDAARRAAALASRTEETAIVAEVARRGAVTLDRLRRFGFTGLETAPDGIERIPVGAGWWVDPSTMARWAKLLRTAVDDKLRTEPLSPGLSEGAAIDLLQRAQTPLPAPNLLPTVVARAGLASQRGALVPAGHTIDLGEAEAAVDALEKRLTEQPFAAPEAEELIELALGGRELAAAERAGRILRLRDGVILLPHAPAHAMRQLAAIDGPFTTSQARQVLGTTRRVAIPLLEHLDARGWTRRVDDTHRIIVR